MSNFYQAPQPSNAYRWIGIVLGGVFVVLLIGAGAAILHLTRKPEAPPAPPPVAAVAPAPAAVAAPAAPAPVVAAAAPAAEAPAAAAPAKHHHKSSSGHHAAKPQASNAADILARHDNKANRKAKDDLDKLLGN
jgi:hypothetical protein